MSKKTVDIKEPILSENDHLARSIRSSLVDHGIASINIMASPGAGKTTSIERIIKNFKDKHAILVIEGDVVMLDVQRLKKLGVDVRLANTAGACHLDAMMITRALGEVDLKKYSLIIVENVGNLICPSAFDLGTGVNVVIASVPEGHDKPYKYPAMFAGADVVLLNKFDYAQLEDFDFDYFSRGIARLSPEVEVFPVSAKTGEGFDAWYAWMERFMIQR